MAIKPQINASAFPEVDNGDTWYQRVYAHNYG
jgi:hypothetical protein